MRDAPSEERSPFIESTLDRDARSGVDGNLLGLDIEDVLELLPHRSPNLLLDRVISLVPGTHGVGLKLVTGNEYGLATRKHGFVFPAPFALEFLVQLATIVLHYPRRFGVRPDAGLKGRVSSEAPTGLDGLTWLSELELLDVRREMLVGDRLYASVSKLGETSSSGEEPRSYRCAGQVYLAGEVYVDAVFHMAALDDLERVRGEDPKPPPAGE